MRDCLFSLITGNKNGLLSYSLTTTMLTRGHAHMSVDIKCLSLDPSFYADLTPNYLPFFIWSTLNDPLFHLCIKFTYKLQIFERASPTFGET